ncbi:MAG: hypothetical protein RBR28_08025 [Lentimicrobium sp.]|jgi:hypothetical protein|nr:hypothetical protein [Lentimicrobium sp.]
MKTGLLYLVFAFFALMLVSLKDADRAQKVQDIPDCQFIVTGNMNGEVPAVSFSLKKVLPEVTYFQPVNKRLVESANKCQLKSAEKACKLIKSEPPGENLTPRILGLSILQPSDTDEIPNLL